MRRLRTSASVFFPAVVLVAACSDVLGPEFESITELPRALSVAEHEVVGSSTAFGFDLMREVAIRDDRPNIVLSPLGASMALAMTLNGADGETFDEVRAALGFAQLPQQEINEGFRDLTQLLTTLDADVRFDIGNSLWANEDVPFHDSFLQAVTAAFEARSETKDFADPATLDTINAWAADHTNGLIDRVLEDLDPSLALLLINAIYFDAPWTYQFEANDTAPQAFRRADGSSVQVDMMSLSNVELPFGGGPGYVAVELPYGGSAFSLVIIVPDADARGFLTGFDAAAWDAVVAGLRPTTVDLLSIPKFELTHDAFLNEALKEMGMDRAFRPGADFSRMSPVGDNICIDFVRQKTFIEVDERGTRAAAVTTVGARLVSFTALIADRPFIFALRERLSGAVLFVGLVGDPTAEDPGPEPLVSDCG